MVSVSPSILILAAISVLRCLAVETGQNNWQSGGQYLSSLQGIPCSVVPLHLQSTYRDPSGRPCVMDSGRALVGFRAAPLSRDEFLHNVGPDFLPALRARMPGGQINLYSRDRPGYGYNIDHPERLFRAERPRSSVHQPRQPFQPAQPAPVTPSVPSNTIQNIMSNIKQTLVRSSLGGRILASLGLPDTTRIVIDRRAFQNFRNILRNALRGQGTTVLPPRASPPTTPVEATTEEGVTEAA